MAVLPPKPDPTLDAADRALEAQQPRKRRPYLGMSGLGRECARQIWSDFRWLTPATYDAATLKRFEDGHHSEDVQATRLRAVSGVTLWTVEPDTGRQYGVVDYGGHGEGHVDGVILGLLQAPKTPHVWEHKAVGDAKFNELVKLRNEGEKNALVRWDATYYGQAQLYMHYLGLTRHYLTCSTPGARSAIGIRTEYDQAAALHLVEKGSRIVFSDQPPARISSDPTFYLCRWCDHSAACHGPDLPARNCRTCLSSTPTVDGEWSCDRFGRLLTLDEQEAGCPSHRYLPPLVRGTQIDAAADGAWVEYETAQGVWRDGDA